MEVQELSRIADGLKHFVLDVWDWEELRKIGKEWQEIMTYADRGYADPVFHQRKMSAKLNEHLIAKTAECVTRIDGDLLQLSEVPEPLSSIVLEMVKNNLRQLSNAKFCQEQSVAHLPFVFRDETEDDITQEQIDAYEKEMQEGNPWYDVEEENHDPWEFISRDLGQYAERIAQHIELKRGTTDNSNPRENSAEMVRPVWNGNAAELAYLLTELIEAGYLVPPPKGGRSGKDGNRAAVAAAVYSAFDIRKGDGETPTSPDYFKSLMRPESPDRTTHPMLFRIRPR